MKLIYINPLGKNYKSEFIYEFLFAEGDEIEAGDDWAVLPASSGQVTPPPESEIALVGILKSSMELELACKSDNFSFNYAVEKVLALGWEKSPEEYEERLVFHIDNTLEQVKDKLYSRDLKLEIQK